MKRCKFNENYSIEREGRVYSHLVKRYLKPTLNTQGYPIVNMQGKRKGVHTLVAEAFIDNPRELNEVNHIDNNPLNSHEDNLEWCTHQENMNHSAKQNRMDKVKGKEAWRTKWIVRSFIDGVMIKEYHGMYEASRDLGVSVQSIYQAIKNGGRCKKMHWTKIMIE